MQEEKQTIPEKIIMLLLSIVIIIFFYYAINGQLTSVNQKQQLCDSIHGTIDNPSCGVGCIKTMCVYQENGQYYSKEIILVNGKYVFLEGESK